MKTKKELDEVAAYDNATLKMQTKLKDFFNKTDYSGKKIAEVTQLGVQYISDLKAYLNKKPKCKIFSNEKVRNVLEDLYKAGMIK